MSNEPYPETPKSFAELMFNPQRAEFEEELNMVLERMKQRGVDRAIIADVLHEKMRKWMTPEGHMSHQDTLEWINRIRRYHEDLTHLREMVDIIAGS